jgi:manganese catalase
LYYHVKKLMYTVRVDQADPAFGNMLLEQFGGANGELAAAMQYSIQGLNCNDPLRKDLLMDIGTEEMSHLEIVGTLARMHLQPMKAFREAGEVDPLVAIAGGGGVCLCNSMGNPWTADYLKITGELDVDLRSNIAAEARAKIVYERLINFCEDVGTRDALQFLMTREITHMKAFAAALESMQKPAFSIGQIPPTPGVVNKYFNDSAGQGDDGEVDARGPWNDGDDWEYVEATAFQGLRNLNGKSQDVSQAFPASETLKKVLGEGLQDLLHAEGQLVKALPKMAKAARSGDIRTALEQHLVETEGQIERLREAFRQLGQKATPKPCKGMAGLIDEGQEVITESKEKDDVSADLGLIAAAQKVEHYEISSYLSARALASQAGEIGVARLLGQSLLEEERADKLLNRFATLLMDDAAESGEETAEQDAVHREATPAAKDASATDGGKAHGGNGRTRPKASRNKSAARRRSSA